MVKVLRHTMVDSDFIFMHLYSIQNTVIIFYIPLIVLILCYALILKVKMNSK